MSDRECDLPEVSPKACGLELTLLGRAYPCPACRCLAECHRNYKLQREAREQAEREASERPSTDEILRSCVAVTLGTNGGAYQWDSNGYGNSLKLSVERTAADARRGTVSVRLTPTHYEITIEPSPE